MLWDLDEIADLLGCFGLTAKRARGCLGAGSFHTRLCARCEWSLMVTRDGSAVHPEQNVHERKASSFLLPGLSLPRCASGLFRRWNTNLFAANLILGFIRRMKFIGPYREQRTSCVLFNRASFRMPGCTTRLQGGFTPVDPHQRGSLPPLLDTPPQCCGGRA